MTAAALQQRRRDHIGIPQAVRDALEFARATDKVPPLDTVQVRSTET